MTRHILVLNAGSSSLKFAAFDAGSLVELVRGQVSNLGTAPVFTVAGISRDLPAATDFNAALACILSHLADCNLGPKTRLAVGHRLVHGGTHFTAPTIITAERFYELQSLVALAPLHLPFGISILEAMQLLQPGLPQVACFDTAFHAAQQELETRLPLPRHYFDEGYRRYGFHGLNYEHVVHALPLQTTLPLPRRLLVAHLGSGASMCGIVEGRSFATTMGFSTADGLIMSTRTGSIDPGVLVALMRDEKLTLEALEDLLYRRSGLLGLSGMSSDMRVLLNSAAPQAKEAVEHYCLSAARHAASMLPVMAGIDAIAFTGGIGENAPLVRQKIMARLAWLNLRDIAVHVVPANEERTIARHTASLLQ
jgi:acetate kinase